MSTWQTVWWFPLLQARTGVHRINPFLSRYGTTYRWRHWREVVLEQSEWGGDWIQTIRLPNGEEIVRHTPQLPPHLATVRKNDH